MLIFPLLTKSQTVYYDINGNEIHQQDTIKIPTTVAKQIVKDLISYDSTKAELYLTKSQLLYTENQSIIKDSIIMDYVQSGLLYEQRLTNEQHKYQTQQLYSTKLEKNIKKLKVKSTFNKILSSLIIGGLTYLYINK